VNKENVVGHIVVFEGSDQVPTYHRCDELADAVSFVEKLRNDRGVDRAQIFRTEEIQFDFRPYYRVELGAAPALAPVMPAPAPTMTPAPPPPLGAAVTPSPEPMPTPSDEPVFDSDDDLAVGSGVRRGLFGR
jgi:hypothetical protein